MLSIFCAPLRYVQGRDATLQLGEEVRKLGLGTKALVIAGRAARRLLDATWTQTFHQAGFAHTVFDFAGECTHDEIERGKSAALAAGAEVIIGAGGGKVLDTGRAVAASLNLPVVNCPTAASSDAPCSALSVVYTADGAFDRYLFYRKNPELVLVDTTVIAKAPRRLLVSGMGDALATWFEADTVIRARKANQVGGATTRSAEALAKLCYQILIEDGEAAARAVETQSVTPALERLVEANTLLSGLGFESGGLAVAHSVHNGLTTVAPTHAFLHGEKVAFGLLVQLVVEGKPQSIFSEVVDFCRRVGLPTSLADVGLHDVSTADLDTIAARTVAPGETAHNEPFTVTAEMIRDAIVVADGLGRTGRSAK